MLSDASRPTRTWYFLSSNQGMPKPIVGSRTEIVPDQSIPVSGMASEMSSPEFAESIDENVRKHLDVCDAAEEQLRDADAGLAACCPAGGQAIGLPEFRVNLLKLADERIIKNPEFFHDGSFQQAFQITSVVTIFRLQERSAVALLPPMCHRAGQTAFHDLPEEMLFSAPKTMNACRQRDQPFGERVIHERTSHLD